MEIYCRDNSVNFGYLAHERNFDGSLAYFFCISATNFGSFRDWVLRLRSRTFDHVVMKRAFIMSSPGDRVYVAVGKANPAIMMENAMLAKKLYIQAGFEPGDFIPIKDSPYNHMKKEIQHSAVATIIYDPKLHKLFRDEKLMQAVIILNDKVQSMEYFRNCGLDIPRTLHFKKGVSRAELKRGFEEIGFPCYLKNCHGAGGWSVWYVKDFSDAARILEKGVGTLFQIQEYISGTDSLNVQYLILPEKVERLLVTKQRIRDERFHMGNDWPADCPTDGYADRVAEECRSLGFVGVIGIDMKEKLIEVNPRQNSSGEMQIILKRLSGVKKLSISIRHKKKTARLADLGLDHLWYRKEKGLLPYEWHDTVGELSVAIINDMDGSLEKELLRLCPQN